MATNRTRRSRNRKGIPEDHWNLLLCRPLKNQFSLFYSDAYARNRDLPTLAEVFQAHEGTIRDEWERTGQKPTDEQLQTWGINQ
jgi:hypothetical protein